MDIGEVSEADTRFFLKSEFGPLSNFWPALSFSKRSIATSFATEFSRTSDFVIYVGTSDPERTLNPEHRSSLLSLVRPEPRTPINTKDIVPNDSWQWAQREYPDQWEWSLPIENGFTIIGYPPARATCPNAYGQLGRFENFGRCVEILGEERAALLSLDIEAQEIELTDRAQRVLNLNPTDDQLRRELSRLTGLIVADADRAGKTFSSSHPDRSAGNYGETFLILKEIWDAQGGCCPLCGQNIPIETENPLLQMSRDRIDSTNKAYDRENLQITHLGCNLGKNQFSAEQWNEYLSAIRS